MTPGAEIEDVITGVFAAVTLARLGEPEWSRGAFTEMLAAFGIPLAELDDTGRDDATRFMETFATES